MGRKPVIKGSTQHKGKINPRNNSFDKETPIWCFDSADNDGIFRLSKETVNSELMIDKLLSLSKMTWYQIKTATHDDGKSKNHELTFDGLSSNAKERIKNKQLSEEDIDTIFSLAFNNTVRLIGLKKDRVFHAIWYDPDYGFYPVE
jgi:hypothetical protein